VAGRVIYNLGGFIDDYGTDAEFLNDLGCVTLDSHPEPG
jgi:hypothetical protein